MMKKKVGKAGRGKGGMAGASSSLSSSLEAAGGSLHVLLLAELRALGGEGLSGDEDADEEVEESASGLHHLSYDRVKGWVLRVTVGLGPRMKGKRLKFRLRTRDQAVAEKSRDLVLATLRQLGLRVVLRMQGKPRGRE